ncbi:MAG TPA: hypothetical protein VEW68_00675 [Patescibacteria group bacterium]|nr:hypothetical protein [Patescibacteria group bacterium]
MNIGVWVLRELHVLSTVFWIGIAVTNIAFVVPTSGKLGPDGAKFMGALLRGPLIMATNGAIVVAALSGLALYWSDSNGFREPWLSSGPGVSFTIGALFGLAAAGVFGALTTPTFRALVRLGGEIQAGGGVPKPEQGAQMAALASRSLLIGRLNAGLLVAALFCMILGGSY